MCAGCRFDGAWVFAVEAAAEVAAALEGCSFSGQVSFDSNDAAVRVVTLSPARVRNCTFSGNDADVQVSSSGVLYTDTPPSALTLSEDSDNEDSIQPLAGAPAGEFPTMASPAFVALRQVRLSRQAAAPPSVLGKPCDTARPEFEATLCLFIAVYAICAPGKPGAAGGSSGAHAAGGVHDILCGEIVAPLW